MNKMKLGKLIYAKEHRQFESYRNIILDEKHQGKDNIEVDKLVEWLTYEKKLGLLLLIQ